MTITNRGKTARIFIIIPNCSDFCVGRIALGVLGQDKDTLYVPNKEGIVRIRNASGI